MNREAVANELLAVAELLASDVKKAAVGRFENAVRVLQDCQDNWDVGDNEDEDSDRLALVRMCRKIGRNYPLASVVAADDIPVDPQVLANLPRMKLNEIASLIYDDHRAQRKPIYFGAKPYLDAMTSLNDINDNYMMDSGSSIVAYLLSNLSGWRSPMARVVKKELQGRLKR